MRVLVVDDDPLVRESCRRILAEEHEVAVVASAEGALAHLAAGGADLVLADIMMPVKDGFFLIEEVLRRWPRLPVLAMSGYSTASTQVRCRSLGAVGFLPKPFSPDELLHAVGAAPAASERS